MEPMLQIPSKFETTNPTNVSKLTPNVEQKIQQFPNLVGGFNPSEKYESNWIISPNRGKHKKN